MQQQTDAPLPVTQRSQQSRITGVALILGAIITTVFNVLFPRAEDPSDVVAVLRTMADNEVLQLVAFLGVAVGLWTMTAGVMGVSRLLDSGAAAIWARLGFYGTLLGVALFTTANGLGLAATKAAVAWTVAGSSTTGVEFAVASALSAADDGIWAMSIIVFWGGLGVLGIGMLLGRVYPKWLGVPALMLGFGTAALAGFPFAYAGVSSPLIFVFAGLGQLTLVWALVTGIWMLRRRSKDPRVSGVRDAE